MSQDPRNAHRAGRAPASRAESGVSLVEVLIAGLIMLFIALGVIPYFAQAMQNNAQGQDSTKVANFTRARLEEFVQLPFNSEPLQITAGTERVHEEYYRQEERDGSGNVTKEEGWIDGTLADADSAGDTALYSRTTTIRQFAVDDLTTPLDSAASPQAVKVKEIQVEAASTRPDRLLGGGKALTVRYYKVK
ncbi:MAG: hypothetical protein R3234_02095 [Thermoanaerobaculia bacterium]|nr:hypothetical protein [Thermoanaerobaculia bacterium]